MGVFHGMWCCESFYWGSCCNMASNILFSFIVYLLGLYLFIYEVCFTIFQVVLVLLLEQVIMLYLFFG